MGLAGYYRRFVRHFGIISKPLTSLLKKHSLFIWTPEHAAAFQALKTALCQSPVLALPNFAKPFTIETDASDVGVGDVLMQEGHPLAFMSKALGVKSRGLSTYEKEFMAILLAVQLWRPYLQFQEFVILIDQKSLTQLTEQRLHTPGNRRFSPNCWASNIALSIARALTTERPMRYLTTLLLLLFVQLLLH